MVVDELNRVSFWTVFLASVVVFFVFCIARYGIEHRKIRALGAYAPSANKLPLGFDLIYNAVRASIHNRMPEWWLEIFSRGGYSSCYTIEINLVGQRVIATADPENIKAILATQFTDYGKGKPFHDDWEDFLGDGIFTTDGAQWHDSRQLLRPQFIKDRVSDLKVFEKHVEKLMSLINGNGEEVDISALFYRFSLDNTTDFLLGQSVGSLDNPQVEFAEAFSEVQRVKILALRAGPFGRFIPQRRYRAALKSINSFVNPYIDHVLCLSPSELDQKIESDEDYTFLRALASFTRNRKVIRDQIVAVLLAGRDTIAVTLSWLFHELSSYPDVVSQLRQEILSRVGPSSPPTYTDLKNMPYLQHTISETLRLYPPIPFNVRNALHDTTLPRGGGSDGLSPIGVPKDTPIMYATFTMQRRADLLFDPTSHPPPPNTSTSSPEDPLPDVLTFSPSRWEHWTPKPWTYIPFNGGPRICIGQQFALTEVGYTVVRMLQRFDRVERYWENQGEQMEQPVLKTDIVLTPGKGVRVGFWERGEKGEEKGGEGSEINSTR